MSTTELRALATRLEAASRAGGLTLMADDLRAAARVVAAMAKLEELAILTPSDYMELCHLPGLPYFWELKSWGGCGAGSTAMEAIEGAAK